MEHYAIIVVQLAALLGILIPTSIQDIRHRSVPGYLVWSGYGVSGVVMSYVIWSGMSSIPHMLAGIMGVGVGVGLVVMSRRGAILLGEADGHFVAILSILVPWHDGIPVALTGITAGCVSAAIYCVAKNISYNIMDMIRGKPIPFDVDIFMTHRKRCGERFTVSGVHGYFGVDPDGIMRTDTGDELFEECGSQGQRVAYVVPLTLHIISGVFAVSVFVYFV